MEFLNTTGSPFALLRLQKLLPMLLTKYIVTRAIDKLNEAVPDNVGILYDKDDDNLSFDPSPLVLEDSTRDSMMVFVVNTATTTYPAAPFTAVRLDAIRNLFNSIPTYNITLRNARHDTHGFFGHEQYPTNTLSFEAILIFCCRFFSGDRD